jgi:tetratricopeptide (TPR) repeat protein
MASTVSEASSAVIDERRAQQLMERAMALAERNELASAVLACRQAIALSPQAAQSYSMLGLLLERAGDTDGAVAAYEKVLEMAPDSFLERESLGRLRGAASQRRNAREMFAFDDNELFGEESSATPPKTDSESTPAAKAPPEITPNGSAPAASESVAVPRKSIAANATKTATERTPSASAASATPAKPKSAIPNNATSAAPAARPSAPPFATTQPTRGGARELNTPLDLPVSVTHSKRQSAWQRLKQRPTPYFRGLPLAGATTISLIFLLWANNYASSNRADEAIPTAPVVVTTPLAEPTPEAPKPGVSPANPALTNQPATSAPIPTNPGTPAASNPAAPAASGIPTNPGAPSPTGAATNPAPTAPVSPTSTGSGSTPAAPTNNTPAAPSPAPAPTPGVAPSDNGGTSANGNPLGPTNAPNKDYVRVAPGGTTPVARPENRAANDERNARADVQAGRSDAAINNLSRAIESGGPDVALRYQQRAQLYLQNGDGARASSDFQAAISAYNDMIARGDRVAIARSGISACRRGLQMAQARR